MPAGLGMAALPEFAADVGPDEDFVRSDLQDPKVPERVRLYDAELRSQGASGEPEGFWYQGKAYIVSAAINTPQDVARVLFHETLGHYGLRGVFGKELLSILQQVAGLRRKEIIAKARDYGLVRRGADGEPSVDVETATDAQVWAAMDMDHKLTAAEEVLAEMAQTKPDMGYVKRAIAAIRAFLRKNVPGFQQMALTDADIIAQYILPARAFVENGGSRGINRMTFVPAMSRASGEVANALKVLSQTDELFALPRSDKTSIEEIAAEHDPEIKVKEILIPGNETLYSLTLPDGTKAKITLRRSGPNSVYDAQVDGENQYEYASGRPGENPQDVDPYAEDVWIDVSMLKPGQNGAVVYNIASTFAHNTNRIFIGDPNGLSDEALRRRAEHMLSSALKFGTTRHLAPHPRQTKGGLGVPALKWVYGDDVGNIERLIDLNLKALDNADPNAKDFSYDTESGSFFDSRTGRAIHRASLAGSADIRGRGKAQIDAQAGWRTTARGAVFRALLGRGGAQGEGAGRTGEGRSVLDGLVRQRAQLASPTKDERVFYSRSLGASELAGQVRDKLFDVSGATGNTLAHYRGMALQTLGRRQLVDIYGDMLPQLKQYDELVQRMDAEKNDTAAEADALATEWGNLDEKAMVGLGSAKLPIGAPKYPGMERKLAELMHDATLAQMDPEKPLQDGDNQGQHADLKARFDALSPKAQSVYRRARDMYEAHYAKVREAIQDRIMRSELGASEKKAMIARMDDDFFQKTKGVYFPLARFGKYVMVVKDADGKVVNVSRAETLNEAETTRKMLLREFDKANGFSVTKVMKEAEFNRNQDMVGKGFVADLFAVLDKQGVDEALRDSVSQLYLSSLPDLSWAKHGIHRKGTPGFSQDARRAFAQNMFHGARYLAKLRYSDQLQNELSAMGDHIKVYEGVDDYDGVKAQQVLDEMAKRHDNLMNPDSNPVSTALTSVGFVYYLGLSPAAAMVNLSQTVLVAYPVMGAKWGYDKAASALLLASKQTVQAKNDISQVLKGDELDAYNRAVADGTIDVTMAHDLAGISQGEDAKVTWALRPVMKAASFMFHHAERFNRQATFIASYRLAKEAGAGHEAAFEQAKKATYDGHFDYSASNRPRIMQGNVAKVVLLFKQYGQNMVYTLARQAYLATSSLDPKEKTQARKQLAGILALHAAAAGVLGLPLVGALLSAASFIGGDDDEPWDAEVAMKNVMADALGPKAAEVLSHGLSRLTPWDLSGRVALNKLILPDVQEGLEGQRWAESLGAAMLGPVFGIVTGAAKGLQDMGEGRYQRGLEAMLPIALRNPVKALRYAEEGAIDKSGVPIKDEVSVAGVLGQASGFAPSEVRAATEVKSAIYQHDKARMDRRQSLLSQYAQAQMAGDTEGVAEIRQMIAKFNEKNPQRRILPRNLFQSVRNREKRIREAEQGVYLPKNRRDSFDAVRFGE